MWNCLWGNALKRSPGIIRKSRVSYPVPGFLSSATWPSLPKKHYNGLMDNGWTKQHMTMHPHTIRILDKGSKHRHQMYFMDNKAISNYSCFIFLIECSVIICRELPPHRHTHSPRTYARYTLNKAT